MLPVQTPGWLVRNGVLGLDKTINGVQGTPHERPSAHPAEGTKQLKLTLSKSIADKNARISYSHRRRVPLEVKWSLP